MEFVCVKMTSYKIFLLRKPICSIRIFSAMKLTNTRYTYKHKKNSVQFQICLGNFKNEPQE